MLTVWNAIQTSKEEDERRERNWRRKEKTNQRKPEIGEGRRNHRDAQYDNDEVVVMFFVFLLSINDITYN